MEPGRIAFGLWNAASAAGRGQAPPYETLVKAAYEKGVRTFITSDSLPGEGAAERAIGKLISGGVSRDELCLIGCSGLERDSGETVRFTDRGEAGYESYISCAVQKSLEGMGIESMDGLLFESPNREGFRSAAAWDAFQAVKEEGFTKKMGIAPGPSNGYALDTLLCLDEFGDYLDFAMLVFNPLEPWPGDLILETAEARGVQVIGRESEPPPGPWVGRANAARAAKVAQVTELASRFQISPWQLMTAWTTSHPGVVSYAPRTVAGAEETAEDAVRSLWAAEEPVSEEVKASFGELREVVENRGKVALKGGTQQFQGKVQEEQWPLDEKLAAAAEKHGLVLDRDYFHVGDPRDKRDFGMPIGGVPQATDRRLFMQLQVFTGIPNREQVAKTLEGLDAVAYADLTDASGLGLLMWDEDPLELSAKLTEARHRLTAFGTGVQYEALEQRHDFTMIGKCYGFGREDDVNYWLTRRAIEGATLKGRPWAVWYPLRRKSGFYRLPKDEQADMLREHGLIGHNYGSAGYAADIRLDCFGMDPNDNEFVLGLLSDRLDWLSRLVKDMRSTKQTGEYMDSLGPFFVGHAIYQHDSQARDADA